MNDNGWKAPQGQYTVQEGGIFIQGATVNPNHYYRVTVPVLGADDMIDIEVAPKSMMSTARFVREIQIVGSKLHWERRQSGDVLNMLRETLTPVEKNHLADVDPKVGPILNCSGGERQMTDEEADKWRARAEGKDTQNFTEVKGQHGGGIRSSRWLRNCVIPPRVTLGGLLHSG